MAPRRRTPPRRAPTPEPAEDEEEENEDEIDEEEEAIHRAIDDEAENERLLNDPEAGPSAPRRRRVAGPRLAGKSAREQARIEAARYEKKKAAQRAKYAAMSPQDKKKRADAAYARAHAGATPKAKAQPAAAQRHDLNVQPHAPLTIFARNVTGHSSAAVVNVQPQEPPVADAAHPTSFANLMAVIAHWKQGAEDAISREKWIQTMRQIIQRFTGLPAGDVVKLKDVSMYFRPVDDIIAKVRDFRLLKSSTRQGSTHKKGDRLAPYSLVPIMNAYMILAQRWTALKMTQAEKDAYKTAFDEIKAAADAEKKGRAPILPMKFDDMKAAVLAKFGAVSLPNVYMHVYEFCPARDDFGSLQIVQQRKDAVDPNMNYVILSDDQSKANGRNRMSILLNKYKTSRKDGPRTFAMPNEVRALVDQWIMKERDPTFLFAKAGSGGRLPAARLPTEDELAQGKSVPGMSSIVATFLHAALPRGYHHVLQGAAITALRKSWATSTPLPKPVAAKMMMHSLATHMATYFSSGGFAKPITINDAGSDEEDSESGSDEDEESGSDEDEDEDEGLGSDDGGYDSEADRAAGALNARSSAADRERRRRGKAPAGAAAAAAPAPPPPATRPPRRRMQNPFAEPTAPTPPPTVPRGRTRATTAPAAPAGHGAAAVPVTQRTSGRARRAPARM